jgi:hypothetical protein
MLIFGNVRALSRKLVSLQAQRLFCILLLPAWHIWDSSVIIYKKIKAEAFLDPEDHV